MPVPLLIVICIVGVVIVGITVDAIYTSIKNIVERIKVGPLSKREVDM